MLIFEIMLSEVPFFIFFSSGPKTFPLFTLTSTLRFRFCALSMSKDVPAAGIGSVCSSVGLPDRKCFEQMYVSNSKNFPTAKFNPSLTFF